MNPRVHNLGWSLYSICRSLSGCLPSRVADNPQGAAIGENIFQHFVLSTIAGLSSREQSLKGSNRYTLRHGRRIIPAYHSSVSLKGSDRYYPVAQPWDLHTTKTL